MILIVRIMLALVSLFGRLSALLSNKRAQLPLYYSRIRKRPHAAECEKTLMTKFSPLHILVLSACLALNTQAATYNAVTDFSLSSNPNGVWTYLYNASLLSSAVTGSGATAGVNYWWNNGGAVPNQAFIGANVSGKTVTISGGIVIPTNVLWMGNQSNSVDVRFTAPTTGSYSIIGNFLGIDTRQLSHPVKILLNGMAIFSDTISSNNQSDPFNLTETLSAGDVIDFVNYTGSTYTDLNTGLSVTIAPVAAPPVITGIVNDASFAAGAISTGSWVAIFGTNLAPAGDSRTWNAATEIVSGKLPVSLDGTSVTVNGKAAVVEFIQPSQVNIQPPDDTSLGPVQVVVTTAGGASNSFTVNYAKFAPGLFPGETSPYIVAQHGDNSYVTTQSPAEPGEVIVLWGTGFGPANPAVPAGQVFSGANLLANTVTVSIGGQPATVDFAGVVGAGLVQINVHVPISINDGDAAVIATVGGASTQTTANMIPIKN